MPPTDPHHRLAGALSLQFSAATGELALPVFRPVYRPQSQPFTPFRTPSGGLRQRLLREARTILAAVAAIAVVLMTAVPAWALIQSGSSTTANPLLSSIGTTGSASTRVAGLDAATFVGDIPFVAQQRYLSAVGGGGPEGRLFVEGARQASIAEYIQDVGIQMTLPYLDSAVDTRQTLEQWTAAVGEIQAREQAILDQQAQAGLIAASGVWQPAPFAAGTTMPAVVTFYSCLNNGFCGLMASGIQAFEGAAACSPDLPMGTRFMIASDPTGRVFTCLDRGSLSPTWVDVWFYDSADGWAYQSLVGTRANIIILN